MAVWTGQQSALVRGNARPGGTLSVQRNTPLIFNAPDTAAAGDVIYVQGDFKVNGAQVLLNGTTLLENIATFSTYWLACRIPSTTVGKIEIQIHNGSLSAVRALNKAIAYHLNCTELRPNGPFRVFGRNLKVGSNTATCTVQGLAAIVDQASSTEHMLVCTAPAGLVDSANVAILVNNGISGHADSAADFGSQLITAVGTNPGTSDVFGLGVGWGFVFQKYSTSAISGLVGDGVTDNLAAFNAALSAASANTILTVGSGNFLVSARPNWKSGIVIKGAGKSVTKILKTFAGSFNLDNGILDGIGYTDLTFQTGSGTGAITWQVSTRSFMKSVNIISIEPSVRPEIFAHTNLALVDVDLTPTQTTSFVTAVLSIGILGLHCTGGTTIWPYSTGFDLGGSSFAYVANRTMTRNLSDQAVDHGDVPHGFSISQSFRCAFINNTCNTVNGPYTQGSRNDGEVFLAEASTNLSFQGTVFSATATTITYQGSVFAFPSGRTTYLDNWILFIVAGKGVGQSRRVTGGVGTNTITVDSAWDLIPDQSSKFSTDIVSMDKSLLRGNVISDQPRPIWLYSTSIRNVDIVNNSHTKFGAVLLHAVQNVIGTSTYNAQWNTRIAGHTVSGPAILGTISPGIALDATLTGTEASVYGISILGAIIRDCAVIGNNPNRIDHAGNVEPADGFRVGSKQGSGTAFVDNGNPGLLGTIFQRNTGTFLDEHHGITNQSKRTIIADYTKVSGGTVSNLTKVEFANNNGGSGVSAPNDTIVI